MSKPSKEASGLGHVDQIREIIVGDHFRDFDARMVGIEGSFADRLDSLEKRLEKSYEVRERTLNKQIERLQRRLKAERADHVAAIKQSAAELAGVITELEARLVDRSDLADLLDGLTTRLREDGRSS